ncbi:N-acetylmuramoyl-L-alanine amidase AmiA [Planctomycetes bacterium Poly30]|uniref:N-acetylmuramoyl-L-alanine amidase n=1 Tax=Saltatorellus ferox TaxID=2528018 RepID=A0A518ELJ3_9BACT|nr:N-acetylmuramoyl-L-alanine amidase AmiA [Planctomycetes bacterium Poly30]
MAFQGAPLRSVFGLASVLGLALFATSSVGTAVVASGPPGGPRGTPVRVMIDPGHGGAAPGAAANGIVEKDINLTVALRLRELLELDTLDTSGGGEWDVRMTRETDVTVSLTERSTMANAWPADRFLSIHHNGFTDPAADGTITFSFANGTTSAALRDVIHQEIVAALGLDDRGTAAANFHVLRETTMPAVLTEAGFLTSPSDAAILMMPASIEAQARAEMYGLQRHYGHAPYLPTDGPTTYCTAKVASPGCVPSIGSTGTASLSSSDLVVYCTDVVSEQFGLLIWGRAELNLPLNGGTLCVGNGLRRTPVQFSYGLGGGNCSGRLELAMDSAFLNSSGMLAGEDIFCQWWFRDPALYPNPPVGLSDGLRFRVVP